jgi:hypothetical protein
MHPPKGADITATSTRRQEKDVMRNHQLTVLEGKWFRESNVSVRDIVRPLFELWSNGDKNYYYEMFTTEASFRAAIAYAFGHSMPDVIYVAADAGEDALSGFHDETISRTVVRNTLKQEGATTTTKRGVLFGSCLFGSRRNAEFLLDDDEGCDRVRWIGGYSQVVDWVDASLLELFFLKHLLFPRPDGRKGENAETDLGKVEYACAKIRDLMLPLARDLEFHVFCRQRGPAGGIRDLIEG